MAKKNKLSQDDSRAYLRYHVCNLVRIWTALSSIRHIKNDELIQVFKDVCSDKLRVMLYELQNMKCGSLGFAQYDLTKHGSAKYNMLYQKLVLSNNFFTGKNGLHARNCSGSHLQPLSLLEHMFQCFGYGGDREWKELTVGVAACVGLMKIIDGNKYNSFWRELRKREIRIFEFNELRLPISKSVEALILDYKKKIEGQTIE